MPVISRPLLIALALAIVALVGFYATQGARDGADGDGPPVAERPQPVEERSAPARDAPDRAAATGQDGPGAADRDRPGAADRDGPGAAAVADRALADAGAPPATERSPAAQAGPAAVRRALRRGDVVVLYFGSGASADDGATGRAVAAQESVRRVTVVREPVGRLAAYQPLVGSLGISQAPAVVVVGRPRGARLLEGFVDAATLRQEVADAR